MSITIKFNVPLHLCAEMYREPGLEGAVYSEGIENKRAATKHRRGTRLSRYPFSKIKKFSWGESFANSAAECERLCSILGELSGLLKDVDASQAISKECASCITDIGKRYLQEV